eukprot:1051555-Amphidinium_carterae.1
MCDHVASTLRQMGIEYRTYAFLVLSDRLSSLQKVAKSTYLFDIEGCGLGELVGESGVIRVVAIQSKLILITTALNFVVRPSWSATTRFGICLPTLSQCRMSGKRMSTVSLRSGGATSAWQLQGYDLFEPEQTLEA